MNSPRHSGSTSFVECGAEPGPADATLRLIASLPAPEGLVDRVQLGLSTAPRNSSRMARILHWPSALRMHGTVARGAAAAAIVMVVVGGGWRVYSRVQPTARMIVMPVRTGAAGGFSAAGNVHTPETLIGPVLKHPVVEPTPAEAADKPVVPPAAKIPGHGRMGSARTPAAKSAGSPASRGSSTLHPQ